MRFPLGQPVRLSTTVTQLNVDGSTTLVNAGTLTLTVQITNADTTTTVVATYTTPSNDGIGLYHQDIPAATLTTIDHYQYTWVATGTGAGVSYGTFDVFDPFEPSVLPLADAKDALVIPQTDTTKDAMIAGYIATIESSLEAITGGPLVYRTITERAVMTSNDTVLQVRQRPLVSVTSIVSVASGLPIDISAGLDLDVNAGTIRRALGWPFYGPYFIWLPAMLVTYIAGWGTAVPATFNTAARIILQHLWETRHGPAGRPSMAGEEAVMVPGFAWAIPTQAAELLDGSVNGMPIRQEIYV